MPRMLTGTLEPEVSKLTLTKLTRVISTRKYTIFHIPCKDNHLISRSTFELVNADGSGGNTLNQTINGLDTDRRYRLAFSAAIFDDPAIVLGESTCVIEALQKQTVIDSWPLNFAGLNEYKPYDVTFSLIDEDLSLSLRLRCNGRNKVTLSVGIDDVSLYDAGPVPDQVVTITE